MGRSNNNRKSRKHRVERVLNALSLLAQNNVAKSDKAILTVFNKRLHHDGCSVAIAGALTAKYLCKYIDPSQREILLSVIGPRIEQQAIGKTQKKYVRHIMRRALFVSAT